jgi:hypothetical protein
MSISVVWDALLCVLLLWTHCSASLPGFLQGLCYVYLCCPGRTAVRPSVVDALQCVLTLDFLLRTGWRF